MVLQFQQYLTVEDSVRCGIPTVVNDDDDLCQALQEDKIITHGCLVNS